MFGDIFKNHDRQAEIISVIKSEIVVEKDKIAWHCQLNIEQNSSQIITTVSVFGRTLKSISKNLHKFENKNGINSKFKNSHKLIKPLFKDLLEVRS